MDKVTIRARRGSARGLVIAGIACMTAVVAAQGAPEATAPAVRPSVAGSRSAADELAAIQEKIRARRADALAQRASQERRLQELTAEKRAYERTIAAIEKERTRREEALAGKRKRLADRTQEAAGLKAQHEALCATLDAFCGSLKETIERSIPWKTDARIDGVAKARELLKGAAASAVSGLAAVGRIARDEEAFGRLVETATLELRVGTDRIAVQGFHLGLLAVAYANKDGSIAGFCQQGQTLEDGLENLKKHPEAADGYLRAIDILERRRTPGVIDLFLPSLPVAKEEGPR
ncbi:MAG: DUF3450 family protein [Planctomycetes bacterium]|nr:DUF3450 family protein [Planctomycetota bacterium]